MPYLATVGCPILGQCLSGTVTPERFHSGKLVADCFESLSALFLTFTIDVENIAAQTLNPQLDVSIRVNVYLYKYLYTFSLYFC